MLAAGLQCLFGIAGYILLSQSGHWDTSSHGIWTTQLIVRLIAGALLVFAGFDDRRTLLFGATTILNATAFARTGFAYLIDSNEMHALRYFAALPLEALYPYYFWQFVRLFPEAFLRPSLDRVIDWAERASLAVGLFLIVSNIALLFYPQLALLITFQASDPKSAFPPAVIRSDISDTLRALVAHENRAGGRAPQGPGLHVRITRYYRTHDNRHRLDGYLSRLL